MLSIVRLNLLLILITGKVISGKHHKAQAPTQTSSMNTSTVQNQNDKDVSTANNRSSLPTLDQVQKKGWNQSNDGNYAFAETVLNSDIYDSLFLGSPETPLPDQKKYLWPMDHDSRRPLVPYRLFMKDPLAMKVVEDAMEEWAKASCIQFKEVNEGNKHKFSSKDYLDITLDHLPCRFGFGKVNKQSQFIHLNKDCVKKDEIVSGLGQSLGIGYAIFRRDREDYITLNGQNSYFGRFPQTYNRILAAPYDYSSVLQPHGLWNSNSGLVTIATHDIRYQGILGRSGGKLSHRDKVVVNDLYNCIDYWRTGCGKKKNPCQNEGYIGSDCHCVCRSGTGGVHCEHILQQDYYHHKLSPCSKDIKDQSSIESPYFVVSFVIQDTWCVWRIMAPGGHKVKLIFNHFKLDSTNGCLDSFLEIREKGTSYGQTYCGDSLIDKEHTSKENELYLYLDVRNNISKGFQADVRFLAPDGSYMRVKSEASTMQLYFILPLYVTLLFWVYLIEGFQF